MVGDVGISSTSRELLNDCLPTASIVEMISHFLPASRHLHLFNRYADNFSLRLTVVRTSEERAHNFERPLLHGRNHLDFDTCDHQRLPIH
jgi:hypothetical protein